MRIIAAALALALAAAPAWATAWKVDKSHSHVTFTVDNLGFVTTQGQFRRFDAAVDFDPENVESASVAFAIQAKSVDTNSKARDKHVRSKEFLDVKTHPEITFISESVRLVDETSAEVKGTFTMKGVSQEETFTATLIRMGADPFNAKSTLAGFVVTGEVTRTDYGVSYGAPAIGVNIPIRLDLQITRETE